MASTTTATNTDKTTERDSNDMEEGSGQKLVVRAYVWSGTSIASDSNRGGVVSLGTFEPESIALLAYLRFNSSIELTVEHTSMVDMSPTGKLPFVSVDGRLIAGFEEIVEYLSKKGHYLDHFLTETQLATCYSFKQLVHKILHYCSLWSWWVESPDNREIIKKLCAGHLPWPINVAYANSIEKHVLLELSQVYGSPVSKTKVTQDVSSCYNSLSVLLGSKPFFFGSSPSTLDALVFGHLACQLYVFPNSLLSTTLRNHRNLVQFCESMLGAQKDGISMVNINDKFLPRDSSNPAKETEQESSNKPKTDPKGKSPQQVAKERRNWAFVGFGILSMVAYGVWHWKE